MLILSTIQKAFVCKYIVLERKFEYQTALIFNLPSFQQICLKFMGNSVISRIALKIQI